MQGFRSSTFPCAIYGMLDSASRRVLFVEASYSNKDPEVGNAVQLIRFTFQNRITIQQCSSQAELTIAGEVGGINGGGSENLQFFPIDTGGMR